MDKLQSYQKTYTITTNYLDRFDDLTPMGILDLFQDIAGRHAYFLGAGYDAMVARDLFWVIARNEVKIIKQPTFGADLKITTWPLAPSRFYFDRMYEVRDESNEVCLIGRSRWLIVDTHERKMKPSTAYRFPLDAYKQENHFSEDFPRLSQVSISEVVALKHEVRASDIDHNQHYNNARYAELIYNALDIKDKNTIESFLIYYISECRLGDLIELYVENENKVFNISGYHGQTLVFNSRIIKR